MHLYALWTYPCPQRTFHITVLCNSTGKNRQGLMLYIVPPSQISIECVDSVLEKCQLLLPFVAQRHCVFVWVISTPLKLTRHLAHSSFAQSLSKLHQPAPAALPPPAAQQGLTHICRTGLLTANEEWESTTKLRPTDRCSNLCWYFLGLQLCKVTEVSWVECFN